MKDYKQFTDEMMEKLELPEGMYKVIEFGKSVMDSTEVTLDKLGKVILSNWNGSEFITVHNAETGEVLDLILRPRNFVRIDGEIYERDYAIYFYCK